MGIELAPPGNDLRAASDTKQACRISGGARLLEASHRAYVRDHFNQNLGCADFPESKMYSYFAFFWPEVREFIRDANFTCVFFTPDLFSSSAPLSVQGPGLFLLKPELVARAHPLGAHSSYSTSKRDLVDFDASALASQLRAALICDALLPRPGVLAPDDVLGPQFLMVKLESGLTTLGWSASRHRLNSARLYIRRCCSGVSSRPCDACSTMSPRALSTIRTLITSSYGTATPSITRADHAGAQDAGTPSGSYPGAAMLQLKNDVT